MVAVIDLGATKTLAGYMAWYAKPGAPGCEIRPDRHARKHGYRHVEMHVPFVKNLEAQLKERPVALGIEGPLWGVTRTLPLGTYEPRIFRKGSGRRQFEEGPTAWYGQSGAQVTAKAFVLLRDLLRHLATRLPDLAVTYGSKWGMQGPPFKGEANNLLLWEAFVTGKERDGEEDGYKPAAAVLKADANVRDAFFAVHHGYANRPTPPQFTRKLVGTRTMPIAGPAIELAGLARGPRGWWNTPCLVIGPREPKRTGRRRRADLLWP